MDPTKTDWTEMNEMSSPNSGKHPSYKRTGSKDSMEVKVIFYEIYPLLFQINQYMTIKLSSIYRVCISNCF